MIAVYPGSFDPCTNGHIDIIQRSSKIFDKLIIGVLKNRGKQESFTTEERVSMLRRVTSGIPNVEVEAFSGLLVDYMRIVGGQVIVKGLRAMSDFEYEFQMALMNRKLDIDIETIFMTTSSANSFLSSNIVREIASFGGNISDFVPWEIEQDILNKLS